MGFLLAGNAAAVLEDGYGWSGRGRKDDVITSAGYRIGPGEIEECLGTHPAVAMAAVVGVPDERRGAVPKGFVALRPGFVVLKPGYSASEALADQLKAHVRTRLAPHEVAREVVFLDDLPRTTTGKITRRALRDT